MASAASTSVPLAGTTAATAARSWKMISNPRNRNLLDLRHRLQAAVWREMRMKLTDYETSHLLKHHPNLLDDENPVSRIDDRVRNLAQVFRERSESESSSVSRPAAGAPGRANEAASHGEGQGQGEGHQGVPHRVANHESVSGMDVTLTTTAGTATADVTCSTEPPTGTQVLPDRHSLLRGQHLLEAKQCLFLNSSVLEWPVEKLREHQENLRLLGVPIEDAPYFFSDDHYDQVREQRRAMVKTSKPPGPPPAVVQQGQAAPLPQSPNPKKEEDGPPHQIPAAAAGDKTGERAGGGGAVAPGAFGGKKKDVAIVDL